MNKLEINTAQNVKIQYNLASLGSRMIAFAIDYFIIVCYFFFCMFLLDALDITSRDPYLFYGIIMGMTLPAFFYTLITETAFGGQTIGKKIMKIKVVKLDGSRADFYQYLSRWTLSIVDIWMTMGGIAITAIVLSKNGQRIGDIAGETSVISLKPSLKLSDTIYEETFENHPILFPQVIKLSDKDANAIKEVYQTAFDRRDVGILTALVQRLETVMEVKHPEKMTPNDFVLQVMKDHYSMFKDK
ncbi:RDD family protein [Sphingobacterium sp. BIGb0165]|uniref:RDD family protein n=1 Tax=Sphingobacterium sp. BIGb0165 TaxID=2940615 RepID=UPI002167AB83|nr:RDD family protein [Sphingobacterium sp. BIGb0165]MCS4224747.1 putative RDD family membrane protein YckC [Sphingobacterium sp. BIGb0165]